MPWRLTSALRKASGLLHGTQGPDALLSHGKIRKLSTPPTAFVNDVPRHFASVSPATVRTGITPLRTVHQFHSGSAYGDAITNAMLLTQRVLRSMGYKSEIFVEHRDPLLADQLQLLDELPRHADYVLLVRHSMGFGAFEKVASLPAPKVLHYHNITPPEHLSSVRWMQRYATLGREQLALWRPRVVAALADSEYNALELRALGYASVASCSLLFDIEALVARREIMGTRPTNAPFTVLFVGRVTASKGQADLVDAFAEFRARFGRPCRLVLVGREDEGGYSTEIRRRIKAHRLEEIVTLTGLISDDDLHEWYGSADLYVSLSHHEGFGVPLVEAMAHGLPVIAWPAGAVPYTLGGAGELLVARDPIAVAGSMLRIAQDPAYRTKIVEHQFRTVNRFRLEKQTPALCQALALAGAIPPKDEAARSALAANLYFSIAGHFKGTYSLAAVNRTLALALESCRPGRVRVIPVEGSPTADLAEVPPSQRSQIAKLAARPKPPTGPEIIISHHYPVYVPDPPSDLSVALVFWEEGLLPEATVDLLNKRFRGALTPTASVTKALIDSGVSIPVRTIGFVPELTAFRQLGETRGNQPRDPGRPFTFLHVSSCFPRKGVDVLLAAYARAFRRTDAVRLVIKGFPNPHNDVGQQIAALDAQSADHAEIVFINEDYAEFAILDLFREADTVVLPSRGEGFNIPAAEAMAAGTPVIITGFGGHLEFCDADTARLVAFHFSPSQSHLATPHSLWVEPDVDDLVGALREALEDRRLGGGKSIARAVRGREALRHKLDTKTWLDRLTNAATELLTTPPPPPPRIAWVSTWNLRCGIAEYSRHLLEAMACLPTHGARSITVLCDERTEIEASASDALRVEAAWRLRCPDNGDALKRAILLDDPEILVIQHQPGLLPWNALVCVLDTPRVRQRATVVTLHNTRDLLEIAEVQRQAVVRSLAGVSRVLVHTVDDLEVLRALGLTMNVTLFPHGAPEGMAPTQPRALPRKAQPIIGCYGFFLPSKGIRQLLEAIALVRREWPNIRLRLVNAEYPSKISRKEIAACQRLANKLGLGDAVEWITDFLPHETSLAQLAKCDLVVLPYEFTLESSSASLRTAIASGAPIAVTPIPIFAEAGDAVARFSAGSPKAISDGIAELLNDVERRSHLQEASQTWLANHSWVRIAKRLSGMLNGLVVSAAPEDESSLPEIAFRDSRGAD